MRLASSLLAAASFVMPLILATDMACGHEPIRKSAARPVTPEEQAAFAAAKPALDNHCARCHTAAGRKAKRKTLKHFNLTRYPPTGHHAHEIGAVVRRVLLGDQAKGKKPTMPADDVGAVTGDDLKKIVAWTEAFDSASTAAGEKAPGKKAEDKGEDSKAGHHH